MLIQKTVKNGKKSEYFLISFLGLAETLHPFWPKVKKKQFFMPPLIRENQCSKTCYDDLGITEAIFGQYLYHKNISSLYFVRYHWHSRNTCTTEISHQLTSRYQVVLSNNLQCVLEHFLLTSFLKIQMWNTGISFLFDHVVPQWPAGPLRSNHYNFCNRNLSNNRIFPNNRRKSIYQIIISIRQFSIINKNISIKHSSSQIEYK